MEEQKKLYRLPKELACYVRPHLLETFISGDLQTLPAFITSGHNDRRSTMVSDVGQQKASGLRVALGKSTPNSVSVNGYQKKLGMTIQPGDYDDDSKMVQLIITTGGVRIRPLVSIHFFFLLLFLFTSDKFFFFCHSFSVILFLSFFFYFFFLL